MYEMGRRLRRLEEQSTNLQQLEAASNIIEKFLRLQLEFASICMHVYKKFEDEAQIYNFKE